MRTKTAQNVKNIDSVLFLYTMYYPLSEFVLSQQKASRNRDPSAISSE